MPKIPRVNGKDAVRAFEKAGFELVRISKSSHHILKKDGNQNLLSIPVHAGEDVGTGLLGKQIKLAGLTVQEFINLL